MTKLRSKRVRSIALIAPSMLLFACGSANTQSTNPTDLAMTGGMMPFYNDGQLVLYEAQLPVNLPIRKPTSAEQKALSGTIGPFDHHPFVTAGEVSVQMTWTVANLDADKKQNGMVVQSGAHMVTILIDPWNEFGRYVPGVTVEGDDTVPNLSGIDLPLNLGAANAGASSRITGTFSYDDMNELATDFATAINIIKTVKPTTTDGVTDDPRVGLVNHVFELQNRSGHDPLTDPYIPPVIPSLVGFNLSLETTEAANVAIEFTLEITDNQGSLVVETGSTVATLEAPNRVYTIGGTD